MKPPIPLPPPGGYGRRRICERCGLRRPDTTEPCPHCAELDDAEVADLRREVAEHHEGHARLGRAFLVAAAVIAVVLLMLLME
jgi:hypothetical protein